jgi:hypothetical protein
MLLLGRRNPNNYLHFASAKSLHRFVGSDEAGNVQIALSSEPVSEAYGRKSDLFLVKVHNHYTRRKFKIFTTKIASLIH